MKKKQNSVQGKVGKGAVIAGRVNKQGKVTVKTNGARNIKANIAGGQIVDARNKLSAKNRLKIKDARDCLAAIAKKSDLRQKLLLKRPDAIRPLSSLKLKAAVSTRNQKIQVHNFSGAQLNSAGAAITRTIIRRTVDNELARQQQQQQRFTSSLPYAQPYLIQASAPAPPLQQYYAPPYYSEPAKPLSFVSL